MDSLTGQAGSLEGDLKSFNNSLASVTEELNATEEQLNSTRVSLEETGKALEAARKKERDQYEAMKKRIQFLYEMNMEGMLEVLLSAENFADFLNKGEYIVSIHSYDRKMLKEYQATKEEIAGKEQKLEEQERMLADLQKQQEGKQQELADLVDSTSEKLNAARKQIADAQADVESYEAEIDRQKAYEAELEKQNAAIAAQRRSQVGSGDRSERIRTYNFPQGRVTDHRLTGDVKNFAIDAVINGGLDPIIDALTTAGQAAKLAEAGEQ